MCSVFSATTKADVFIEFIELLPKHNVLGVSRLYYIDRIFLNQSLNIIKATSKRSYDNQQEVNIRLFCWILTEDASLEINTLSAKCFGLSAQLSL